MSSFVTPTDIAKAIKICYQVYDRCFTRYNQADVRYRQFLSEIKGLASALEELEQAYRKVEDDLNRSEIRPHSPGNAAAQTAGRPGIDLAGDFLETVKECEKLLKNNEKFGGPGNRVLQSVEWHYGGTESRVKILRERLGFHSSRILVILKPLELAARNSDSHRLARIEQQLNEHIQSQNGAAPATYNLPPVPTQLADRYQKAALEGTTYASSDDFPLNETFNALLYHFSRITASTSMSQDHNTKKQNALLKTRWILQIILKLSAYQSLPLCTIRSVVTQVEVELKLRQSRLDAGWEQAYCGQILLLSGNWAKIWCNDGPRSLFASVTDEREGETKVLDVPLLADLNGSNQRLLLFKQPRSRTEFRLLKIVDSGPAPQSHLDTHMERFVPVYALPDSSVGKHEIQIYQKRFGTPEVYHFEDRAAAILAQQAFTNYDVIHDSPLTQWTIAYKKGILGKTFQGTAKLSNIQIWYPQSFVPAPEVGKKTAVDVGSSKLADDILSSYAQNNAGSFPVSVRDQNGDGRALIGVQPEEPALVIFTKLSSPKHVDTLGYIFVPLDTGIGINRKRCGCASRNSTCLDVVLEMKPGKRDHFNVKAQYALDSRYDDCERDWNLFLFCNPKPAEYRNLETIEKTRELHLRFTNVEQRKLFELNFLRAVNAYSDAIASYRHQSVTIRARADRTSDRDSLYPASIRSGSRSSFAMPLSPGAWGDSQRYSQRLAPGSSQGSTLTAVPTPESPRSSHDGSGNTGRTRQDSGVAVPQRLPLMTGDSFSQLIQAQSRI